MADTVTRDEIRAAVAYGQQLATRRILDALRVERKRVEGWHMVGNDKQPQSPSEQRISGYDEAVKVVKAYRIADGEGGRG